jgi:hypothetical protein
MTEPYHALGLAYAVSVIIRSLVIGGVFFAMLFVIDLIMEDENEPT